MKIDVDVTPTHINEAISKAVLDSQLGIAVKERIEEFLNKEYSYGKRTLCTELDSAVSNVLRDIVVVFVREKYTEKIKNLIVEKLTDETLNEMIDAAWKKLF